MTLPFSQYLLLARTIISIYSLIPLITYLVIVRKGNQQRNTNISKHLFFVELTRLILGVCIFRLTYSSTNLSILTVIFDGITVGLWYFIFKMNLKQLNNN